MKFKIPKVKMTAKKSRLDNLEDYQNRRRLMWVNDLLANPKVYTTIYLVFCLFIYCLINYIIKTVITMSDNISVTADGVEVSKDAAAINIFTPETSYYGVYLIAIILLIIGYIRFAYKFRTSFEQLNIGQKGTSRWTTREELDAQYKCIPDSKETFPGGGGFPVARTENKIYIDDSPVNNIVIGITRSGKGEIVVFSEIDIYSRAEKQASMIIIDPKLELASSAIPKLAARGYDYHILNLIDPNYSMGFNPLALVLQEYKDGQIDDAQLLCGAFCYSIFNPDQAGDNKFFEDNSTALLTALILASIDDNLAEDKFKNEKAEYEHRKKEAKRKDIEVKKLKPAEQKLFRLQEKIKEARKYNPEITDMALAKEIDVTADDLTRILSAPEIKINYKYKEFIPTHNGEKNINMFSIINTFSKLSSVKTDKNMTMLDDYFIKRPEGDTAKLLYTSTGVAGDKTKGSIYSNMLTALKVFTFSNISKMTAESTLNVQEIGFGKRPVAIFIGTPDYDKSNYFLVTAFIRQTYFTLAKMATHAPGEKCYREVIFLLDEFGNIPPIENMASIITICLGRNIRFNLIIQSYQQIHDLYGDSAKTIIENCGNQAYILTNSTDTAKEFSELLDTETITNVNRTGKMFSINKERTEMQEERALLAPGELRRLMPGEFIVCRVMKRNDLKGNPVRPYPIANMNQYRMKYRYEYLIDDFPAGNILYDTPTMRKVYEMIRELQMERIKDGYKEELIGEPKVLTHIKIESPKDIIPSERLWPADEYLKRFAYIKDVFSQEQILIMHKLLKLPGEYLQLLMEENVPIEQIRNITLKRIKQPANKDAAYMVWDMITLSSSADDEEIETEMIWKELEPVIATSYPEEEIETANRLMIKKHKRRRFQ